MDFRHPVRTLQWAIMQAAERDLNGLVVDPVSRTLSASDGKPVLCRPSQSQCAVVLFEQIWKAAELGMARGDADETVLAETVIVTGPAGDACVYVSTQLLYHVHAPNRRFFLDVSAQQMRPKCEAPVYEGRDTADLEALDFEAATALARVKGAAMHIGADDAARIARQLEQFAAEVREAAGCAPW
ncbi:MULTISPECIES: hypothetical protein [Piscinibacter]|uniref:hypothetical protein n=1 Tax=Piscinibacter TaxID=1114981 RepID=UPI000FDD9F57|nr:hypothetical protein [Piscinibacter defluvii]